MKTETEGETEAEEDTEIRLRRGITFDSVSQTIRLNQGRV
jgi:hypothetical protein